MKKTILTGIVSTLIGAYGMSDNARAFTASGSDEYSPSLEITEGTGGGNPPGTVYGTDHPNPDDPNDVRGLFTRFYQPETGRPGDGQFTLEYACHDPRVTDPCPDFRLEGIGESLEFRKETKKPKKPKKRKPSNPKPGRDPADRDYTPGDI